MEKTLVEELLDEVQRMKEKYEPYSPLMRIKGKSMRIIGVKKIGKGKYTHTEEGTKWIPAVPVVIVEEK